MINASELALSRVAHWEKTRPNEVWMTQPMGGGKVITLTWKDAIGQARRMATHLKSLGYEPGSHIALMSKNCAQGTSHATDSHPPRLPKKSCG